MADNDSKPWPPALAEGKPEITRPPVNKAAGWASLGLALLLLVVQLFTTLALSAAGDGAKILGVLIDSSPVLLVLWICAIVFGIMDFRSLPGKLGIIISLIDLCLYGYLYFQFLRITF